jgi:ADP-L-glycero-D-manno-heptose 6-epimerase
VHQGIFNCGSGASRSFNDIARSLIGQLGSGRIEYFPMPPSLAGKYQSFTRGDISALRNAGFAPAMHTLEQGIAASVPEWQAQPVPATEAGSAGRTAGS